MEKITSEIIGHSKELLSSLKWHTYPSPFIEEQSGFYGYIFKRPPEELQDLWLGTLENAHVKGVILGAKPHLVDGTRRVLIEGFKWLELIKPIKSGWFYKQLIAPKNIQRLAKMSKREREKCLLMLLENTYPFAPE